MTIILPKVFLVALATIILSSGVAIADKSDHLAIKDKISDANKELKKANAVGFEWRDSGKLLKKADKASKDGNYQKAEKLISKAVQQAHLAVAQAAEQKNAGPR